MSAELEVVSRFCSDRLKIEDVPDFPGAENGLQIANDGQVTKVGAAVDAGMEPFRKAVDANIDFLIVHHGLYWNPPVPLIGVAYEKIKLLLQNNIAVYSSHLPLDGHPEIGNNAIIARKLGLRTNSTIFPYEGVDAGLLTEGIESRQELRASLENLFPNGIQAIEFGSENLGRIAILSGSGNSVVSEILGVGTNTLVTGELRQHHFNMAQELGLNLYACGHYATETFGVDALGREVGKQFGLGYEFIETSCPL
ncbi:MAG: Nif3-like dinuclear metal center hexameric protein [Opitutae bacterium]|nr:Nif3-like dinuclear metal center hexameric protein [Opitutae bacterium]|tara:strand:+ start:3316 stop:4074 length:759 start_codon:yes stop_codon:yes gene_type:complete